MYLDFLHPTKCRSNRSKNVKLDRSIIKRTICAINNLGNLAFSTGEEISIPRKTNLRNELSEIGSSVGVLGISPRD